MQDCNSNQFKDLLENRSSYFFSPKYKSEHLLSIQRLVRLLGLPSSTLRRWERNGSFPKSCRPNGEAKARYWRAGIVKKWLVELYPPETPHEELSRK